MASVLILDDDPNARLLLRTLLAHAGHSAIEAADGEHGLALARERLPDLIVFDLSMPAMSGPEFLQALRRDEATRELRVALYTASTIDAAMRDFMEIYGVAAVLPKPGEPAELLAAIDDALDPQRQSRISGMSSP
ncbi:MAG TPA: response regulator [Candidatus Acidoferrales bacterium]|nr:response regulator [Candidatus Acidoferrales bacterium]